MREVKQREMRLRFSSNQTDNGFFHSLAAISPDIGGTDLACVNK